MREKFIQELITVLPVHPVTVSLALRTGQLERREPSAGGTRIPL